MAARKGSTTKKSSKDTSRKRTRLTHSMLTTTFSTHSISVSGVVFANLLLSRRSILGILNSIEHAISKLILRAVSMRMVIIDSLKLTLQTGRISRCNKGVGFLTYDYAAIIQWRKDMRI